MSWNNVLPFWFWEMEEAVNDLNKEAITYEEFVEIVKATSIPEHNKEHLIKVWHPEWDGEGA